MLQLLLTLLDGPEKKPWQTIKFDVYDEDDVTNMVAATDINELLVLLIRRRGLLLELNVSMAIIQKEGRPIYYLMIKVKVDKREWMSGLDNYWRLCLICVLHVSLCTKKKRKIKTDKIHNNIIHKEDMIGKV